MGVKDKAYRRPQQLVLIRDTPTGGGTTTPTAAIAAGATGFSLTSATNFAIGDAIRIGTGEDLEFGFIGNLVGVVVTLATPTLRAHAATEPIVEQTVYDLGATDGGVELSLGVESTDQTSDTQRLVYNVLTGFQTAGLSTKLLGHTLYYWCVVLGIPFSAVTGSKTSTSPLHFATDFSDVDSVANQSLAMASVLQDGSLLIDELHGVNMDYTGIQTQLARGTPGSLPMKAAAYGRTVTGMLAAGSALPWTATQTLTASKDDLFAAMSTLGFYSASGTATTVATAAAKDAVTLVLTDASTIAGGDWILVNSGGLVETHWVLSKATNTLTLKTPLKRAQAVGVRVVKAVQNLFAAVQKGGMNLNIGGTSTDDFVETRQLSLGKAAGGVTMSVDFKVRDLTLANLAASLGIPVSAIASNRLVTSELLASAGIEALFCFGTLKSGVNHIVNLWGCAQDLANAVRSYNGQQSDQVALGFTVKPTGGFQMLQY